MKKIERFGIVIIIVLLSACSAPSVSSSATITELPASATVIVLETTATVTVSLTPMLTEVIEQATATPETNDRVVIEMSSAVLEHEINDLCKEQFPVSIENNSVTVCFTFDNWVFGPVSLGNGHEMIAGAEVWYEQDGVQIAVLIPLSTAHRGKNEMQIHNSRIQEFFEFWYEGREKAWESNTNLRPGDTLWVTFDKPTADLKENSTQGFGFEAAQYTREQLEEALRTGDFSILGNLLWPVIDIEGRD